MNKFRKWLLKWEIDKIEITPFPPFIKITFKNKGIPK